MPVDRDKRVPRRTADIELWDVAPVGNREAWRREMLQFWGFMATRGKRIRGRKELMVLDEGLGKNRYRTTKELAALLAERTHNAAGVHVASGLEPELATWLEDAVIVPGERGGKRGSPPAAGLFVPHYASLLLFNRAATRERFWAAFMYSALDSDVRAAHATGRRDLAGAMLDDFLALGTKSEDGARRRQPRRWHGLDMRELARRNPEVYITAKALATPNGDGLGDASEGLPESLYTTATAGQLQSTFLCPGAVVLMRRTIGLLHESADQVGHAALADLTETALSLYSSQYYLRGIRVMNELSERRTLPEDCSDCWARYQADLHVGPDPDQESRWSDIGYAAAGDQANAAWVDETCKDPGRLFANAGAKELAAAKDLGRMSLERMRRDLAGYTVNRISLSVASKVAGQLAKQMRQDAPGLDQVYAKLDEWARDPSLGLALSLLWTQRIRDMAEDPELADDFAESLDDRLAAASGDPGGLERLSREVVAETVLSSRSFSRYIEVLHSLLGGGALPSNQDPKGLVARGGNKATPFHIALNDRALELMVAVASLEADAAGEPLSFQGFIDFLDRRFHILVDRPAPGDDAPAGLVAAAAAESRGALRARLTSMGLLQEYSDSSEWNRVAWGARQ